MNKNRNTQQPKQQPEIPTRSYMSRMYHNMKSRCYNESYLESNPKYRGCTVCQEWLENKENFYEWVQENWYTIDGEQVDLDKDIIIKGNKTYSPETCVFVPHIINSYFERLTRKPLYIPTLDKWQIDICIEGKTVHIGLFDTEEDAKTEYIRHKEAALLALADRYRGKIPEKLYHIMANYKIELSDWDK